MKLPANRADKRYTLSAELRSFNSFNGDCPHGRCSKNQILTFIYVSKIFAGDEPTAKERAKQQKRIEKSRKELKEGIEHNEKLLEQFPDDQELIKCTEELKEVDPAKVHEFYYDTIYSEQALHERIKESFAIYFEFLSKTSQEAYKELQDFIDETIKNRDKLDPSKIDITDIDPKAIINTFYPVNFLTPTDKVSNLAFSNELTGGQIQQLAMERRGSKKQITTLASIDFEKLNGSVEIKSRKELTAYDREVHDAIITLFVDGGNEYITPQMIYQVMTGTRTLTLTKAGRSYKRKHNQMYV